MKHAFVLLALLAAACGGGGGDDDDPLAPLAGTWAGPAFDSAFIRIVFDADGTVTSVVAGTETQPGPNFVEPLPDDRYRLTIGLQNGTSLEFLMVLAPSGDYAALLGTSDLWALQRGASAPRTTPIGLGDLAPATWEGRSLRFDATGNALEDTTSSATFLADGSYAGTTALGLSFSSVGAAPINIQNPAAGTADTTYEDDDPANDADGLYMALSVDGLFLAAIAYPEGGGDAVVESRFLAAWERD